MFPREIIEVVCGGWCCFKNNVRVPSSTNPIKDGWTSVQGNKFFDPHGNQVWLCPDCSQGRELCKFQPVVS